MNVMYCSCGCCETDPERMIAFCAASQAKYADSIRADERKKIVAWLRDACRDVRTVDGADALELVEGGEPLSVSGSTSDADV